ncbi:MAG: ECF transporter S component [Treponemataceae bacterium]|nr:ECF transporter S component [Treponemataceae bacterium]
MDNTSRKNRNFSIALTGAMGALTVLFAFTRLGMIPWFSGASITILHVPVILCTLIAGIWAGSGVGLIFGVSSLIVAATQGEGLDLYFVNPLISVLPRLCIAPAVYFSFLGFKKISQKTKFFPLALSYGLSAFIGTMANSFLVLGALVISGAIPVEVMFTVLFSNTLLEAAAAVIICVAVILIKNATISSKNKKSKFSQINESSSDSTEK